MKQQSQKNQKTKTHTTEANTTTPHPSQVRRGGRLRLAGLPRLPVGRRASAPTPAAGGRPVPAPERAGASCLTGGGRRRRPPTWTPNCHALTTRLALISLARSHAGVAPRPLVQPGSRSLGRPSPHACVFARSRSLACSRSLARSLARQCWTTACTSPAAAARRRRGTKVSSSRLLRLAAATSTAAASLHPHAMATTVPTTSPPVRLLSQSRCRCRPRRRGRRRRRQ
jgi:hypothetical protein